MLRKQLCQKRGMTLFPIPSLRINLAILNLDQAQLENDFQLASLPHLPP
ncbi:MULTISPECIES: hypothetical protein [unclassified Pseudomonas]|nr:MULTISPECIES: hypothetical protein [unclassified Pseudomonas]